MNKGSLHTRIESGMFDLRFSTRENISIPSNCVFDSVAMWWIRVLTLFLRFPKRDSIIGSAFCYKNYSTLIVCLRAAIRWKMMMSSWETWKKIVMELQHRSWWTFKLLQFIQFSTAAANCAKLARWFLLSSLLAARRLKFMLGWKNKNTNQKTTWNSSFSFYKFFLRLSSIHIGEAFVPASNLTLSQLIIIHRSACIPEREKLKHAIISRH